MREGKHALSPVMNPVTSGPAPLSTGPLAADPALRGAAAVGLITVGVIHALEIQGQLSGAVWLTVGFCLLAGGAPLAGLWLLVRPALPSWALAGLVGLCAAAGYILTRSVAVPGDPDDRGNWLEPLGLAALIIELLVVILAVLALASQRRAVGGVTLNNAQKAPAGV
jgi:hypothetical protein